VGKRVVNGRPPVEPRSGISTESEAFEEVAEESLVELGDGMIKGPRIVERLVDVVTSSGTLEELEELDGANVSGMRPVEAPPELPEEESVLGCAAR
jgi:hypothetical protein